MTPTSVRRAVKAHPHRFDAIVAVAVAGLALVPTALGGAGRGLTAHDIVGAGVTLFVLLVRHRASLTVLSVALLCAVASIAAAPTSTHVLEATALIVLYTVAATSP